MDALANGAVLDGLSAGQQRNRLTVLQRYVARYQRAQLEVQENIAALHEQIRALQHLRNNLAAPPEVRARAGRYVLHSESVLLHWRALRQQLEGVSNRQLPSVLAPVAQFPMRDPAARMDALQHSLALIDPLLESLRRWNVLDLHHELLQQYRQFEAPASARQGPLPVRTGAQRLQDYAALVHAALVRLQDRAAEFEIQRQALVAMRTVNMAGLVAAHYRQLQEAHSVLQQWQSQCRDLLTMIAQEAQEAQGLQDPAVGVAGAAPPARRQLRSHLPDIEDALEDLFSNMQMLPGAEALEDSRAFLARHSAASHSAAQDLADCALPPGSGAFGAMACQAGLPEGLTSMQAGYAAQWRTQAQLFAYSVPLGQDRNTRRYTFADQSYVEIQAYQPTLLTSSRSDWAVLGVGLLAALVGAMVSGGVFGAWMLLGGLAGALVGVGTARLGRPLDAAWQGYAAHYFSAEGDRAPWGGRYFYGWKQSSGVTAPVRLEGSAAAQIFSNFADHAQDFSWHGWWAGAAELRPPTPAHQVDHLVQAMAALPGVLAAPLGALAPLPLQGSTPGLALLAPSAAPQGSAG